MAASEYVAIPREGGGLRLLVGTTERMRPVPHLGVGRRSERMTAGYSGGGPLDTALSILVDALEEGPIWHDAAGRRRPGPAGQSLALALCHDFMAGVVSRLPQHAAWSLPRGEVLEWVDRTLAVRSRPAREVPPPPMEYVARDLPVNGIRIDVGPVDRHGDAELRPVRHLAVRGRSQDLAAGYCGSGPLDTSLSILVDALGEGEMWRGTAPPPEQSRARTLQHRFMEEVVSRLPQRGGWRLAQGEVRAWAARTLATRARERAPLG